MTKPITTQIAPLPAAKAAWIRELMRDRKARDKERAFVLEGEKPIRERHRGGAPGFQALVVTPEFIESCEQAYRRALEKGPTPLYLARSSQFDRLSDLQTSQGILAVVAQPRWDESAIFARPTLFGAYGDRLQDPAHVGSMIRSALAFGVDALWLSPDSVDVWNPKVVRGTAGAVLSLPVFSRREMATLLPGECVVMAAVPPSSKSRPIQAIQERPAKLLLAFGNESSGLSDEILRQASLQFHIPLRSAVESLNVASAAAIAMYHFSNLKEKEGPG
ncbi:MAG: RNA methyltransferase [Nitrospirae bacterium]|nr:RNA methyltransferase [Nitrospirota bacterium]